MGSPEFDERRHDPCDPLDWAGRGRTFKAEPLEQVAALLDDCTQRLRASSDVAAIATVLTYIDALAAATVRLHDRFKLDCTGRLADEVSKLQAYWPTNLENDIADEAEEDAR